MSVYTSLKSKSPIQTPCTVVGFGSVIVTILDSLWSAQGTYLFYPESFGVSVDTSQQSKCPIQTPGTVVGFDLLIVTILGTVDSPD